MVDLTNVLGGPWSPHEPTPEPAETQVRNAMAEAGLDPPEAIHIDGKLHRFATNGKKGDDAGWYILYPDGVPAGTFGNWRDGIQQNWRMDVGRSLTAAEEMAFKRRQDEARTERRRQHELREAQAHDTVSEIWLHAGAAAPDHPYLQRKRIQPNGARVTGDGRLIVPLYAPDGQLASLQYIDSEGAKQYHAGASVKGCQYTIGVTDDADTLYIAEGFATAATIHEATGKPCAAAYSASNLSAVAEYWRAELGHHVALVVVADADDHNVGRLYADQAASRSGARVVIPPVPGDANDYALAGHDLYAILHPPRNEWLIPADTMSEQPAPIRWHVKRWLQAEAMIMLHGPPASGKTFVVMDMVMRAAAGLDDWFGYRVSRTPVVYLAGEGHHGMRGRIAAWKQAHSIRTLDMWVSASGCGLNTPEGTQKAIEAVRDLSDPPGIIVVDTLHRFLEGDENSAQDARAMLEACANLMGEFGCTVVLVHHTGVSEEAQHRARGSSAWRGALDIEISVIPEKAECPGEIVQRKAKDAEVADPVYFSLEAVEIPGWVDEDGDRVASAVLTQAEVPQSREKERDEPIARHLRTLQRAWWASGAEVMDGKPYVSRSALVSLLQSDGMKQGTINNNIAPGGKYGTHLVGTLLSAEILQGNSAGWRVMNDDVASSWIIQKNQ